MTKSPNFVLFEFFGVQTNFPWVARLFFGAYPLCAWLIDE